MTNEEYSYTRRTVCGDPYSCGNISPPFKAEQTTVTTAAPTVSAAASSEAESTVDEEQVKHDTFIAEFFDSNICFVDTSTLVTEAMKGCSFDNELIIQMVCRR